MSGFSFFMCTLVLVLRVQGTQATTKFQARMTVNEAYRSKYNDSSSAEFKAFASNFSKNVEKVLSEELSGIIRVNVTKLSNGSVVVDFDIVVQQSSNASVDAIKQTLKAGNGTELGYTILGEISVNQATDQPSTASSPSPTTTVTAIVGGTPSLVSGHRVSSAASATNSNTASASVAVKSSTTSNVNSLSVDVRPSSITSNVNSTNVDAKSSNISKTSSIASASVSVKSSSPTINIASASVDVKSSQNTTTSIVTSASIAVKSSSTTSNVASASAASSSQRTTAGNVTSTSVAVQISHTNAITSVVSNSVRTIMPSLTPSVSSLYSSANSNASLNGSASPGPTPGISPSGHFSETSQPMTQVSPNASSISSSTNMTKSSQSSTAVLVTAFTPQSASTLITQGQTSKTSMLPSSIITLPSTRVGQSSQVGTSTLAHSFSKEMDSFTTQLLGSLTVSRTSFTSTPSINATSTASSIKPSSPSAQPTALTLPPEGTRFVSMEVTFDIEFEEVYKDTSSLEYEQLKSNLTKSLEKVYKNVDGFIGVRILFITEGSVVCSYIVILAKNSKVKESELDERLQQASDEGDVFKVKRIKIAEDQSKETEDKLPKWALVVMIVLGCLSAVFLVTVIYVCVKYRRSFYGNGDAYLVTTGEIGLIHTYDTVSIGNNKTPANKVTDQKPAAERRVIGSHTNPTYGSNGALAD